MALDGMFLHFLTLETAAVAVGAKVDKVHQPTRNELVLHLRTREGTFKLLLTADANVPRFNFTGSAPENPQTPPMFCMLLRKRLTGAALVSVEQVGLDRIVFFNFSATNEIGDRETLTLAVEIMARHSNIILFDENKRIIDAIKRVDSEKSSFRLVLPGAQYSLPPEQNKLDLRSDSPENALTAVLSLPALTLSSAILKTIQGVSPLLSRELALKASYDSDIQVSALRETVKQSLLLVFADLKERLISGRTEPTVIFDSDGKPREFSFLPVNQYGSGFASKTYDNLSELLEDFYSERDRINRAKSKASELYRQIDTAIERVVRKLNVRRAELSKSIDRDALRVEAELITANQYRLEKGASFYEVEDYYDDNKIRKIKADPALSPSRYAQKLYKEYRKACTAETKLKELISDGESDLLYLGSVKDLLERSETEREYAEIKAELVEQGFLKSNKSEKKGIKRAGLPPLEFKTSEGFTVNIGRNNIQNDRLTFKIAHKGDMWLHAQKAPGSHTVLFSGGREITDKAIVEAAQLAAYYSSQKESPLVTVDYSDVKNIKKPNGSKPGFVIYYTYYSVNVKPINPDK